MSLRAIRDWIRAITPFEYVAGGALLLTAVVLGQAAVRDHLGERTAWDSGLEFLMLPIGVCTIIYGLARPIYFNPIENRPYGSWLATTPWRYPQPLPLGPIRLVWQDVVILAILTSLFATQFVTRLTVPILFLFIYSLVMTGSASRAGIQWPIYGTQFLLGCLVMAFGHPWIELGVAVLAYVVAYAGIHQVLERWPFEVKERERLLLPERERHRGVALLFGWPMPPGRVERWNWSISHRNALLVGAIVGWLLFSVSYQTQGTPEAEEQMQALVGIIVVTCILARLAIYLVGYVPPISFLGRIATGRLIIPGFDIVFVAPLTIAVVVWAMTWFADTTRIPTDVAVPAISSVCVWLALALPPRRASWQLAGHHRIAYRFRTTLMQANSRHMRMQD